MYIYIVKNYNVLSNYTYFLILLYNGTEIKKMTWIVCIVATVLLWQITKANTYKILRDQNVKKGKSIQSYSNN
jgi:hypothetical protein